MKAQAEAREASASAEAAAVRMQAEAEAAAVRVKAEAEAESIRLRGNATAEAIAAEAAALRENQDAILAKEVIGQLPQLMAEFAKGYDKVGNITLIGGDSAATHLAREQSASLTATFESVKAATGLDLGAVIQGQALGRGIADGAQTAARERSRGGRQSLTGTATAVVVRVKGRPQRSSTGPPSMGNRNRWYGYTRRSSPS